MKSLKLKRPTVILCLFLTGIFRGTISAQTSFELSLAEPQTQNSILSQQQDVNAADVSILDSPVQYLNQWTEKLLEDSKYTFIRSDNLTALLLAGGISTAMQQGTDLKVADYLAERPRLDNFIDDSLDIAGDPLTLSAAATIWYYWSQKNNDSVNTERARILRTALTLNSITTWSLKIARSYERPNGEDFAWPSGHTSSSFTVASVLDEFYGPKVGIPAYAVAGLVAYRMVDSRDHWAGDVVFGATLGWVVGHSIAQKNSQQKVTDYFLLPYVPAGQKNAIGISLVKFF